MSIKQESTGPVTACDGCGRTDEVLNIQPYTVHDPNIGSAVGHHYCAGCAANRGLLPAAATIPGWVAAPAPRDEDDGDTRPARSRR
jgi:hypothetical protein